MTSSVDHQQQQPQLYQYSFKIETTAKGLAVPSIHVYSNNAAIGLNTVVERYAKMIEDLKDMGFRVATDQPATNNGDHGNDRRHSE